MSILNMFEIISLAIKRVTTPFNGVLNPHTRMGGQYLEYQDEILSDLEMKKASEDKMNLKKDGHNIRKDINKATRAYHAEVC